ICDKAAALKLNALIFQVRPAGDAVYKSDIEPWSPWFTGAMAKAPEPMWDPLEFFINEAHARGIELHAWFNPFRALSGPKFSGAGKHISLEKPEWCWRYGEDLWMDPGEPGVRARSLAVMMDVLRRYDVDGIHMDDYFYPYPLKKNGAVISFPDERAWNAAKAGGSQLSRSDWRRENVNSFVRELYAGIKKEKPWVRFGISPFGLWRPGHPDGCGKGALDPYEELAADSLKWLQNGWCDYLAPQLYWPIEPTNLSFTKFFDWWLTQNTARRHIWPGVASDRVLKDRQPHEILKQISYTRARINYMPPGHIHWNFSALAKNVGTLADLCATRAYQDVALVPSAVWLGEDKPPTPQLLTVKNGKAEWTMGDNRLDSFAKWWFVQTFEKDRWVGRKLLPVTTKEFTLPDGVTAVAVRGIGRTGIAGEPITSQ
ncbi:MAG: glycoside hydrolase family 10 protein, partial [Roseimicrobium sp.]